MSYSLMILLGSHGFFPLKYKSQVLASFQHFKNTMENHLGTYIKTLRTDCGGEYTNNEFGQFCSQSGIIHQFTCPHTSQQNGIAERKHRHIVDMALTLISYSSLPFQYWTSRQFFLSIVFHP